MMLRTVAIALAMILLPQFASSQSSSSKGMRFQIPNELMTPEGAKLVIVAEANGDQIYTCKEQNGQYSWTLKAPEAQLLDQNGKVLGRHFAGPSWELNDKSAVTGKMLARADSPDNGAIPWLLLGVVDHSGNGLLRNVSHIQRLNTKGGKAPGTGCDGSHAGEETRVPYSASYLFYEAKPAK